MKNVVFIINLVLVFSLNGQVNTGTFYGNSVEELVWSKTKDEYLHLEAIQMKTCLILTENSISFKKGENANWLKNEWVYDNRIINDDGSHLDRYYDQMNQMVIVDYSNSQLLYYYNWDPTTKTYLNIAIYKNLSNPDYKLQEKEISNVQKIIAKFIITDASVNGIDNTPILLDQGAYSVFYTLNDDEGTIYMANYWEKDNTQSYGPMYSTENNSFDETIETYKADLFNFNWRYINDYDNKKGTAKVELTKIYKPQGITFILKIIPENLDIIIYKGYMDGTVDFSKYK
jgi:hypothetical protein